MLRVGSASFGTSPALILFVSLFHSFVSEFLFFVADFRCKVEKNDNDKEKTYCHSNQE